MKKRLKIIHHSHSGRYREHEHTSYPLLAFILLVTGMVLAASTFTAYANTPPPQAESVGLTGTMPGPPPEDPAQITSPANQTSFSESPVTISGTCPAGSLVEILKNNIFAGSTICTSEDTFTLDIDLLIGQNELIARVYNSLNQPGPNSDTVTVSYDALPPQEAPLSSPDFDQRQLLLNTDAVYRGVFPDETLTMPIEIIDGTPPFALEVHWGDNSSQAVPRDNNQPFRVDHVYKRPGTYQITLKATDAAGRIAFLSVAAIINGQPDEVPAGGVGASGSGERGQLTTTSLIMWVALAAVLGMVLSFWMGEQREKRILADRGLLISNNV